VSVELSAVQPTAQWSPRRESRRPKKKRGGGGATLLCIDDAAAAPSRLQHDDIDVVERAHAPGARLAVTMAGPQAPPDEPFTPHGSAGAQSGGAAGTGTLPPSPEVRGVSVEGVS
jgi:hypothetical protein